MRTTAILFAAIALVLAPGYATAQMSCSLPPTSTAGAVEISLALDQTLVTFDDRDALVMLEVRGDEDAATARTPVSLAVVVDVSGSMEGDKIEHARRAAGRLVDRLAEGDLLTLITYNESARTLLDNYAITADRQAAHAVIDAIDTRGNTCISCGLQAAYAALDGAPHGHLRRVVMLSDGNANRGVTHAPGLRDQAGSALSLARTVTSTIGVGADYNEELMTAVSVGGTGAYYFLPDGEAMANTLASILDRELAALERTVATDVAISLSPDSGVTLGDTEAVGAQRDGEGLVFNLGQLSAGEVRRFIVPLALPEAGPDVTDPQAVVRAEATFQPVGGEPADIELVAHLGRTDDPEAATASMNPMVVAQQQRLASASDIDSAMRALRAGNRDEARRRLRSRAAELEATASAAEAPLLLEEAEAVRALADELEGDLDAGRARELYLQNQARGNEVRQGVEAEGMFHMQTVH